MTTYDPPISSGPENQSHWAWRATTWLIDRLRPDLGWLTLFCTLTLAFTPLMTLVNNRWLRTDVARNGLITAIVIALLLVWWLIGWRNFRNWKKLRVARVVLAVAGYMTLGLGVLSVVLARWLPGPLVWWRTMFSGDWPGLANQMIADLTRFGLRFSLWWQSMQGGRAVQDDLVLAAFAGVFLWLLTGLLVWLVRRTQNGLLSALPVISLVTALLFWGKETRWPMIFTCGVALLLHFWLHQSKLWRRWETLQLDYSPSLLFDRLMMAGGSAMLVLALSALIPNLYSRPLALWYWNLMQPANQRFEALREQILPEPERSTRWRNGGFGTGLPNQFLLGAGPELGTMTVMLVRTNDSGGDYYEQFYEQEPPGHYMRALTLSDYDGRGWQNPKDRTLDALPANQRWVEGELTGRELLLQSVDLRIDSPLLFAAAEAVEVSVDSEVERSLSGDLISLRSWEPRYSVISAIPAVGDRALTAAGNWSADRPLPDTAAPYLHLPESVPRRVRDLAQQLTITATTLFAKSQAIEAYLRQFPYDLAVDKPPAAVTDVADYFLFDLQRGYCDYYATAFIVLARAVDVPARFATGYAVGSWDRSSFQWVISEAEAHSWPEVFFPEVGWVAFEPTAGRPSLTRVDRSNQPQVSANLTTLENANEAQSAFVWNWQMLFWVLPVTLLSWVFLRLGQRWIDQRRDPWQALIRWGERNGSRLQTGKTILEYGGDLSDLFLQRSEKAKDADGYRAAARQVTEISAAVSTLRYGDAEQREVAKSAIDEGWQRLRDYVK